MRVHLYVRPMMVHEGYAMSLTWKWIKNGVVGWAIFVCDVCCSVCLFDELGYVFFLGKGWGISISPLAYSAFPSSLFFLSLHSGYYYYYYRYTLLRKDPPLVFGLGWFGLEKGGLLALVWFGLKRLFF